jgi:hypothetical protein
MSSQHQIDANRRNAQKSTGPTCVTGKAVSSMNALKTVDDLIYGEWLKRRLRAAETQIWAYDHQENYRPDPKYPLGQTASDRGKALAQPQWRIECNRRASRQALQDLQQLQAEAAAAPRSLSPTPETTSPQIGFVLPFPSADPPQPAQSPQQCDISHISDVQHGQKH